MGLPKLIDDDVAAVELDLLPLFMKANPAPAPAAITIPRMIHFFAPPLLNRSCDELLTDTDGSAAMLKGLAETDRLLCPIEVMDTEGTVARAPGCLAAVSSAGVVAAMAELDVATGAMECIGSAVVMAGRLTEDATRVCSTSSPA